MVVGRVPQEGGRLDRTELTEADQREKARYEGPLSKTASCAPPKTDLENPENVPSSSWAAKIRPTGRTVAQYQETLRPARKYSLRKIDRLDLAIDPIEGGRRDPFRKCINQVGNCGRKEIKECAAGTDRDERIP